MSFFQATGRRNEYPVLSFYWVIMNWGLVFRMRFVVNFNHGGTKGLENAEFLFDGIIQCWLHSLKFHL